MNVRSARSAVAATAASLFLSAAVVAGGPFITPDNGFGTVDMPPNPGVYTTPLGDMHIIDGLAPGDTIDIDSTLHTFFYNPGGPNNVYSGVGAHVAGGVLGGSIDRSDGTLTLPMIGTGSLAGFNRLIPFPVSFEIHNAPRGPAFSSPQTFATQMHRFFGQIVNPSSGDPDFDLLRIVAGNDFGMPSPGNTILTDVGGGMWNVDSFFDITYRIDFVGRPGGALSGRSGSTTREVRIVLGEPIPAPGAAALLGLGGMMAMRRRRAS